MERPSTDMTGAPALERGLRMLRLLATEGPLSLDAIRTKLDIPRSSAFRLLETLCELGYAQHSAGGGYSALWQLRPLKHDSDHWPERLQAALSHLSEKTGSTAEWWTTTRDGLVLEQQVTARQAEVSVRAAPGFKRGWHDEFEAVTRLGLALAPDAPALCTPITLYVKDGEKGKVCLSEARTMLRDAAKTRATADVSYNNNAVRRCAHAVLIEGEFRGILAIAQTFTFHAPSTTGAIQEVLAETAQVLSRR